MILGRICVLMGLASGLVGGGFLLRFRDCDFGLLKCWLMVFCLLAISMCICYCGLGLLFSG